MVDFDFGGGKFGLRFKILRLRLRFVPILIAVVAANGIISDIFIE